MTLIAFATSQNRADILTDTWAYTHFGRLIARNSKVQPIAHLNMAHITQGNCGFGSAWDIHATILAMGAATFDEFADSAQQPLRQAWSDALKPDEEPSTAFLVGYSPAAGRFLAYLFASESNFERQDVTGLFVIPAPIDTQPSSMELARIKDSVSDEDPELLATALEFWAAKPKMVAPTTVKGWVALGKHVRESRALIHGSTGLKVFVAGDLQHSVLKQGEFTTSRVHSFNDSGAEFAQLVAGTLHPVCQWGPCSGCDSGRPYVDCCLAPIAAEPCMCCGSGKPFQACCSVRAPEYEAASPEPVAVDNLAGVM